MIQVCYVLNTEALLLCPSYAPTVRTESSKAFFDAEYKAWASADKPIVTRLGQLPHVGVGTWIDLEGSHFSIDRVIVSDADPTVGLYISPVGGQTKYERDAWRERLAGMLESKWRRV